MRRFTNIDNLFVLNYGLTIQEAVVLEWMIQLPSWAEHIIHEEKTYFFASKNKAVDDLNVLTDKIDTMYRYYKKLSEKGFVLLLKSDGKDFVHLNPVCQQWNNLDLKPKNEKIKVENNKKSDFNPTEADNHPTEIGQSSEKASDNHPTYRTLIPNSNNKTVTLFGEEEKIEVNFLPEDILNHLNSELKKKIPTKRGFGPVDSNLKDIKARIRDKKVKYTLNDFKAVIEFKIHAWHGKEKTRKWLRPSTLFGEKFDQYLSEALESNENGQNWGNNNFVESKSDANDLL